MMIGFLWLGKYPDSLRVALTKKIMNLYSAGDESALYSEEHEKASAGLDICMRLLANLAENAGSEERRNVYGDCRKLAQCCIDDMDAIPF